MAVNETPSGGAFVNDAPVPDVAGKDIHNPPFSLPDKLADLEKANEEAVNLLTAMGVNPVVLNLMAVQTRIEILLTGAIPAEQRPMFEFNYEQALAHNLEEIRSQVMRARLTEGI